MGRRLLDGAPCWSARRSVRSRCHRQRRRRVKGSGSCSTRARPGSVTRTGSTAAGRSSRASSRRSATRSTGRTATSSAPAHDATATTRTRTRGSSRREPRALRRGRDAEHVVEVRRRQPAGPAARGRRRRTRSSSYVQNGGGIAAIHNATDAGAGQSIWDWWDGGPNSVVGTTMPGHAATNATGNVATVQVADRNHLSTKDLPDTWTFADEHYNFLRNVRGDHHVLATFDERTYTPGVNARGQDHPITWCKLYDGEQLDDGTPTRRDLPRRPHVDHRHGPLRRPLHRERRRQQPGQDDRRRHPLGRRRGQEDRLLGHGVVELPPHGPGRRRQSADRHRRGEGRQGLLVRDGPGSAPPPTSTTRRARS